MLCFDQVPLSEVAKQFFPFGKKGPDFNIKVSIGSTGTHQGFIHFAEFFVSVV